jgi:hypothetical protein
MEKNEIEDLSRALREAKSQVKRETTAHFRELFAQRAEFLRAAASFVLERRELSLRGITLARLLLLAARELQRSSQLEIADVDIPELAWAARNLLELVILYEDVLDSDESLLAIASEQCRDEIDIYLALATLSEFPGDEDWCKRQIATVEDTARKANLTIPKAYQRIKQIADRSGYTDEYGAVYSLYSKWVHPTAWQIGSGGREHRFLEDMVRRVLLGRIIAYSELLLDSAAGDGEWTSSGESKFDKPIPEERLQEEPPPLEILHDKELGELLLDLKRERRGKRNI